MKKLRIIARLDVKSENVVKGVQFECLRVMGKPDALAEEYLLQGADEIIYLDTVANLYQRQNLVTIVDKTTEQVNIPLTVGGGIRNLEDIRKLLMAGADKVTINTAAIKNPELITAAAEAFGSQCIVLSIEAKRVGDRWEAYTDNARERPHVDAITWAKQGEELGAGEILITSVDQEGTESGFDLELIKEVVESVSIPVIASGGAGTVEQIQECAALGVDGIAVASLLHYQRIDIDEIKQHLHAAGFPVRLLAAPKKVSKKDHDFIVNYNKFTLHHLDLKKNEFIPVPARPDVKDFDIGVLDYGINNVKSVLKGFEMLGKKVKIITTPEEIRQAKALVLPGVGAFKQGIEALENRGLAQPFIEQARQGIPVLGICLGMQLLFTDSYEFGHSYGMDLIPGSVVGLKDRLLNKGAKIPHIGWNDLNPQGEWGATPLQLIPPKAVVYFVHSFFPDVKEHCIATTNYGDFEFCVAVKYNNITGMQFHPEKSGLVGKEILKGFCVLHCL